ncbi:integrase [Bradyrhizobium sp. USDA 4504]
MLAVRTPGAPLTARVVAACGSAFPFERQGRLLRSRSISGLFSRSLHSGLQPPCLRFATAVTGRHARLGSRLLARLCRGRHLRRQTSTRLQGATLTEPAVKLLQQQLERSAGEPWVFPSVIGAGHLVGLPKAWARVLRRAKIKNLRIHDIRRSVGTAMARTGASPHLIATGLGHRSIASARAYVRLAGEDARQALSDAVASLTAARPRDV